MKYRKEKLMVSERLRSVLLDKTIQDCATFIESQVLSTSHIIHILETSSKAVTSLVTEYSRNDCDFHENVFPVLKSLRKILRTYIEEAGMCEHGIGICRCQQMNAIVEIDEILECRKLVSKKDDRWEIKKRV